MRKLKLEMQISLDGFTTDTNGSSSWMVWNWTDRWTWDDALRKYHTDLTVSSDCILLSRKMAEEGFNDHWRKVAENSTDPQYVFAKHVVDTRKIVFSNTLSESTWKNNELAKGELNETITALKREHGKDIIAYGGPTFASSLLNAGLIDELNLFVNPSLIGNGTPCFKNLSHIKNVRLNKAIPFSCGVVVLNYLSTP